MYSLTLSSLLNDQRKSLLIVDQKLDQSSKEQVPINFFANLY